VDLGAARQGDRQNPKKSMTGDCSFSAMQQCHIAYKRKLNSATRIELRFRIV
jgi:hypothetical protein